MTFAEQIAISIPGATVMSANAGVGMQCPACVQFAQQLALRFGPAVQRVANSPTGQRIAQAARTTGSHAAAVVHWLSRPIVLHGFRSFDAFKRAMGPAGPGHAWHHIVEQHQGNINRFGAQAIHSLGNIVRLPHGAGALHNRISGLYSSVRFQITGSYTQTVREWVSTKSFDEQYQFGLQAIHNVSYGIW